MSLIGPVMFCNLLREIEESLLQESFNRSHSTSNKTNTEEKGKNVIVCGKKFTLSDEIINEIPYFKNLFLNHHKRYAKSASNLIPSIDHIDPALLNVIIKYLENNCKSSILFGSLPKDKSCFNLLKLFDSLLLRPPIQLDIIKIKNLLLKPPKDAFQFQDDVIKYAFAMFYCLRCINWNEETHYRESIMKNLMFVLNSTDICFQPRLKFHFMELALDCVIFAESHYESLSVISIDSDLLDMEDIEIFGSVDHCYNQNNDESDFSTDTLSCLDSSYDSIFHSKISLDSEYAKLFGDKFSRSNSRFSLHGKQEYLSYSSNSVLL